MKPGYILFVLVLSLLLAACGANTLVVPVQSEIQPTSASPVQAILSATEVPGVWPGQVAGPAEYQLPELVDSQGAVTVRVKPLDLGGQEENLKFEVTLDTHSVDLSMDLAALATLTTDAGLTVQAAAWDAPRGGHHVSGSLSFPASVKGKAILSDASKLTLIIKDVDTPERAFTWDLK